MNHLTDEQFEDIIQGETPADEHLDKCIECRAILQDRIALARRLRRAFDSVHPGSDLAGRIRMSLSTTGEAATDHGSIQSSHGRAQAVTIILRAHRRLWSGLAAAAAILILAIPVALYVSTTSQARASQAELVAIHHQNVKSLDGLVVNEDPNRLVDHMKDVTGHAPAMIRTGSDMSVCGCRVLRFRGRPVGSYVVQTATETISIVVIPGSPKSLGLRQAKTTEPLAHALWHAKCDDCHIVSIRIGNLSYYAISEASPEELQNVLRNLIR